MTPKAYKILAMICSAVSLIGLLRFLGGPMPVNIGAFVFPLALAILCWYFYKKKGGQ